MTDTSQPQSSDPDSGGFDGFRVSQPLEIQTLLGQMAEQNVLISLTAPRGITYTTTIWEVDRQKRSLCLGVEPAGHHLDRVLGADELVAVGYLDQVKIQFDVDNLMQVHGANGDSVLTCLFPAELYRFQRRSNYRVRPLHNPPPVVRVRSRSSVTPLELRVVDVSVSGVALLLPQGLTFDSGAQLVQVDIELDAETRFTADLNVMHVSPLKQNVPGGRMGCELAGLNGAALRALQRFIDQTQKRRRAMAWSDI